MSVFIYFREYPFPTVKYCFSCHSLPDDVWLIDLDANKITAPPQCDDIPPLPEPECTILKNHLKQVRILIL